MTTCPSCDTVRPDWSDGMPHCPTCGVVTVTFPETVAHDAETVTGMVVARYPDAVDILRDDGETFTLFDREIADGNATIG